MIEACDLVVADPALIEAVGAEAVAESAARAALCIPDDVGLEVAPGSLSIRVAQTRSQLDEIINSSALIPGSTLKGSRNHDLTAVVAVFGTKDTHSVIVAGWLPAEDVALRVRRHGGHPFHATNAASVPVVALRPLSELGYLVQSALVCAG